MPGATDIPAPLKPPAMILIERTAPRAQSPDSPDLAPAGLALLLVALSSSLLLVQAARVQRDLRIG